MNHETLIRGVEKVLTHEIPRLISLKKIKKGVCYRFSVDFYFKEDEEVYLISPSIIESLKEPMARALIK